MKKLFTYVFLCAVAIASLPSIVRADGGLATSSPLIQDKDDIIDIAESVATWIYSLFFVVAVLYILLAAFTYLTAKDNADKVKKAQASLKNAVIAIVIALISTSAALIIKKFIQP